MKKRLLSILLCLSMILQFVPTMAMATGGVQICTHHVHDDSCGYAEAVDGAPCAHVHDEICGYAEGVEEVLCACTTTDESGMLLHEEGCGYLPAVPASDCTHVHDEVCGYAEMIPGQPCTFHCDECLGHDHGEEEILPPEEIEPPVVEPEESAPECTCESEDPEWHAPFCDAYVAPEEPECLCVEVCGEAGINEYCDICWFDPEACAASGEEQAAAFATADIPDYISKIAVAYGAEASTPKNILKNNGFTLIDYDLNKGCGSTSHYIYMGYKTTKDPSKAITGIYFLVDKGTPATYTFDSVTTYLLGGSTESNPGENTAVDLNADAKGAYIYTYVTRDARRAPITEISFDASSSKSGYVTPDVNLNERTKGGAIYLHYKQYSQKLSGKVYYIDNSTNARKTHDLSKTITDHTQSSAVPDKGYFQLGTQVDFDRYKYENMLLVGWRDDDTAGAPEYTARPSVNLDNSGTEFRGIYKHSLQLSYNANGGSGAPAAQKMDQYFNVGTSNYAAENKTFTIPSTAPAHAAKCGFLGWSTSSSATSATYQPGKTISIKENTTLYAVYKNHTMSDNICTSCGYSDAVPGQVSGVYQIGNKAQLIWFMQHVNAGNRSANAVLTADIDMGGATWTPIASTPSYHATAITDWGYEGTFDGNGHVISNFKVVCENGDGSSTAGGNVKSYGLFGTVKGTVKNLGIDSFTFDGDKAGMADCRAGGVVGQLLSGGTVENCYTIHSEIRTDGRIAGGIAGCNYGGTIKNCFAYGNTVTGHSRCAAIVGDTVTDSGAPTKYTGTVTNCYADKNPVGSQNGGSSYVKNCATLTAAQFKSGEAAYKLGSAWGQTIGSDSLPVLSGKTVYRSDRCTGLAYSNSDDPLEEGGHYYGNKGVCEYCNRYIANAVAVLRKNGKNVFAGTTLDDVITEAENCAASDKAVVTILQDIDLGTDKYQMIDSGVFTIDLNGCKISYDHVNYSTLRINNAGTDITLISSRPGGTVENRRSNGRAIMTGRNTNLTATGITVITGNEGYAIYLNGSATLTDVTIQACEDGIHIQNTAKEHDVTLICTNCTVQATKTAVFISDDCTATITGGSLTGKEFDIIPAGSVTVAGTTFPGGIQIQSAYRGLNEILAEGYVYWAGDTMLSVADEVGSINGKGDITVKAACTHQQGEKQYANNGEDHTYTWSCCNLAVTEGHTFKNTKCVCGARDHDCRYTNGICSVIKGCYQPAEKDENGVYLIGNAGQLYWFAQQVNLEGEVNAKARLTDDIDLENRTWYPIGVFNDEAAEGTTAVKQYQGTFDGDGHTVSNFTAIGTGSQGLIGYSDITAVVKNVGVINATVSGWNAGAVLAYMGTVENCYAIDCKVTAATTAANVNKVYAGAVAGTQMATVKNCFAYDCEVLAGEGWEEKSTLAPIGGYSAEKCYVENCYYAEVTTNQTFRTSSGEISVSSAQMASGEVAYKLQGEQTEQVWGQTIPGDRLPVLGGAKVYQVKDCIGVDTAYRNINEDYTEHVPGENGFCFICGAKLCDHSGNTNADDGDCTTAVNCSICGTLLTPAEDAHDFNPNNDYKCENTGCTAQAVASVTIGDTTEMYLSLDAATQAVSSCTAADNAVVALLTDMERSEVLTISGGVFTFDLNGKILSGGTSDCLLNITGGTVTIADSSANETGAIRGGVEIGNWTTAGYGVRVRGGTVNIVGGTITGGMISGAVQLTGGAVNISGGTINGGTWDIGGHGTIRLTLAEGKTEGAFFPGGITLDETDTTLKAILGDGAAYWNWKKGTQLVIDEDKRSIVGDVVIKAACGHSGNTNVDDGNCTTAVNCSNCGISLKSAEDAHDFNPNNDYKCKNTGCTVQAPVSVTIGGIETAYATLDAATQAVENCTAEDNAVVTLLTDMERSKVLTIESGEFTLDLNGKTLTGTDPRRFLTITGGTVTIADSSENETGVISSRYGSGVIVGGGTVNISGGKINGAIHGVQANSGTVNITGGTISGNNAMCIEGGTVNISGGYISSNEYAGIQVGGGTVNISGSTVIVGGPRYNGHGINMAGGTLNVLGGTINGGIGDGIQVSGGIVNISGGTIGSTTTSYGLSVRDGGTVNIIGGSIIGNVYGVWVVEGTANIGGGTITSNTCGVHVVEGATANISGGSITGSSYDLWGSGTILLTLAKGETKGASFPGNIEVRNTTLNAILDDGAAYWQNGKQIVIDDDDIEIKGGDVVIRKACDHSGSTHTGDCTKSYTCTTCGLEVTFAAAHNFGADYKCTNTGCTVQAAASVTIDGIETAYATLDAATQAVENCTAEDNAVVTLLTDIERSEALKIKSGVFTFDLNGKTLSGGDYNALLNITGGTVTIADSSAEGTGTITGTGTFYGMHVRGGTVNITGGSISGVYADILNYGTVLLTLAEGKTEGASFPGGITLSGTGTTLKAILGDGAAYWQGDKQIDVSDNATRISGGDVVIKAACDHSGSMDDGDCTTAEICSNCGLEIAPAMEDHTYSDSNNKCINAGCTYAYVTVFAVDSADGGILVGTTLQILDAEGMVCAEWQSHSQARVDGLHTGVEYTLRVTYAPAGYQIPGDHSFTIDDAGKVTYTGSFNEKGYLLVELNAYEVLCGTDENNLTYSNLEEALADSTYIRLNTDVSVDTLLLQSGRTFDLNGHTLWANRVVAFSGSHIIDTQNGEGRLRVDADKILLPETNSYLPIKTNSGYAFVGKPSFNEKLMDSPEDTIKYAFQPLFGNVKAHELMAADAAGTEIEVRVDWTKGDLSGTYQFVYGKELLKEYLSSYDAETDKYDKMLTITLKGTDDFSSLKVYAVVSGDLGVDACAYGRSVVTSVPIME